MAQTRIIRRTRGPGLYAFTQDAAAFTTERAAGADGLLTCFVRHTSASLIIQENADPDVLKDLSDFFACLVPSGDDPVMAWLRHTTEGPDDMPAHIKSALTAASVSIPVSGGRLALGTWQGLYLFEHRDAPHTREIILHLSA
jgi:secondary thiamine-phosphate synthase enzyme